MVQIGIPSELFYFSSGSLSNLQKLSKIIEWINFVGNLIGCDILRSDYRLISLKSFFAMSVVLSVYVINAYCLYLYSDDLFRVAFLLITVTISIQFLAKLQTFVVYRKRILDIFDRIEKFLSNYNSKKSNQIFAKWILISCHIGLLLCVTFIGCSILCFIIPIIYYFVMGEFILISGLELPFIDWMSPFGYFLNYLYMGICANVFVVGSIASTFMSIFPVVMSFGQYELLKMLLDELEEDVKRKERGKEIKEGIKEIAEMHVELTEFLIILESTFKQYYFLDLGCLLAQNVVNLFAIATVNFIPGYMVLILSATQSFLPCLMGTLLILEGEKYYANLCNISWHLMSLADQKSVSLMIVSAIRPRFMSMGLSVIDLQLFVDHYKKIYSYFMILESLK